MGFESVKGSGNIWEPKKESNGDPKEVASPNDFIDGYYIDKKDGLGEYNATMYTLEKKDGERFDVWGTTALNKEMDKVRQGQFIRIQWLGKLLTKKGAEKSVKQRQSTDSYHAWDVLTDKDVAPLSLSQPKNNENVRSTVSSNSTEQESSDLPF